MATVVIPVPLTAYAACPPEDTFRPADEHDLARALDCEDTDRDVWECNLLWADPMLLMATDEDGLFLAAPVTYLGYNPRYPSSPVAIWKPEQCPAEERTGFVNRMITRVAEEISAAGWDLTECELRDGDIYPGQVTMHGDIRPQA